MGFSKDQLLARLQELQIDYSKFEHPVVLTVEAQAEYVGKTGGAVSKNLFLKDKKHRLYIVSAMTDTKVDLKVLSQRLGLGKGGLKMAPEEAVSEILQVPLGCVTPFAVINESARDVALLLDEKFKTQAYCFFQPLANDTSISLNVCGLDKFLKSTGRDAAYVDLEANPTVGKDQPPDLAPFVPSGSIVLAELSKELDSLETLNVKQVTMDKTSPPVEGKSKTMLTKAQNSKDKSAAAVHPSFSDPQKFIEAILNKTSLLLLSEINNDTVKQGEQLGMALANSLKKQLTSDFTNLAIMYKNTAYSEGFYAGINRQPHPL